MKTLHNLSDHSSGSLMILQNGIEMALTQLRKAEQYHASQTQDASPFKESIEGLKAWREIVNEIRINKVAMEVAL